MESGEGNLNPVCEQMLQIMSCSLDGQSSDDDVAALSDHLEVCASCRERELAIKDADRLYQELNPFGRKTEIGSSFTRRVMAELNADSSASAGGVRGFLLFATKASELQQQLLEAAADQDTFIEQLIILGRQQCYRFDADEAVEFLSVHGPSNDELSDEQLDDVVGGVNHNDVQLISMINRLFPDGFK